MDLSCLTDRPTDDATPATRPDRLDLIDPVRQFCHRAQLFRGNSEPNALQLDLGQMLRGRLRLAIAFEIGLCVLAGGEGWVQLDLVAVDLEAILARGDLMDVRVDRLADLSPALHIACARLLLLDRVHPRSSALDRFFNLER